MHGSGLLLLSAVAGYLVLERAEKQRGSVRRAGRMIGWLVVIASFAGVACTVLCSAKGMCGMPSKAAGYCPLTGKAMKPMVPSPAP